MKRKKIVALMLAGILVMFSLLAGCGTQSKDGSGETTGNQTSKESQASSATEAAKLEPETLKLYCVGDKSAGSDRVVKKANEMLQSKINATIQVDYLPWTNWDSKYQLIFASGEKFDAIYTANWTFYAQMAVKNGFKEIKKDMLEKYAPNVLNDLPEDAWRQAKINGKIYMVPTTFNEYLFSHIAIRGDLREKYNIAPLKSLDDLEAYLQAIKDNEKEILPLRAENTYLPQLLTIPMELLPIVSPGYTGVFYFKYTDPGINIINIFETPEFKEFAMRMNKWQKAGFWSKNALLDKSIATDQFKNGKVAAITHNMLNCLMFYLDAKAKHPDWKVEMYDGSFGSKVTSTPYIGSGIGIHASSEKWERALMFIDYARTDPELNDLFNHGEKGVDFVDKGPNLQEKIISQDAYTDGLTWVFRNNKYQRNIADAPQQFFDLFESYKTRTVTHPMQNFNFDTTNVKNEMAAIGNVYSQYAIPLITGFVDPNTEIDVLNKKLKEAGADKVMKEIMTQAEAFMQSYNQPVWGN